MLHRMCLFTIYHYTLTCNPPTRKRCDRRVAASSFSRYFRRFLGSIWYKLDCSSADACTPVFSVSLHSPPIDLRTSKDNTPDCFRRIAFREQFNLIDSSRKSGGPSTMDSEMETTVPRASMFEYHGDILPSHRARNS